MGDDSERNGIDLNELIVDHLKWRRDFVEEDANYLQTLALISIAMWLETLRSELESIPESLENWNSEIAHTVSHLMVAIEETHRQGNNDEH